MKVRVELICDDPQGWVDLAERQLGAKSAVAVLGG
jgi:hypothetical protein